MDVSKTSDHIQIMIKMPNPSQEPQVSSKAPTEDLKDMDVLSSSKTSRALLSPTMILIGKCSLFVHNNGLLSP